MSKYKSSKTLKLSNAYLTGGGGINFEHKVQAVFLLALLADGFSPILEKPIKEVQFQVRNSFYTDDLLVKVDTVRGEAKLLCNIKHKLSMTYGDRDSLAVFDAAWNDFKRTTFNKNIDKIVAITEKISSKTKEAFQRLHENAMDSMSAANFLDRINNDLTVTPSYIKNKFNEIRSILDTINKSRVTDDEIWLFFRVFNLLVVDLNYENSLNKILVESLIKSQTQIEDAIAAWKELIAYAADCDARAAGITLDNFNENIKNKFSKKTLSVNIFENFENNNALKESIESDYLNGNCNDDKDVEFITNEFLSRLAIIGSWNEKNKEDQKLVEIIVGKKYDYIQSEIQKLVTKEVPYIKNCNSIWKIINREQIILESDKFYFDNSIKNIFDVINLIVLEYEKNKSDYSMQIKRGILEGFCFLCNKSKLINCSSKEVEKLKYEIIKNIFTDCTYERLNNYGDLLCIIGEISPKHYLDHLENFIKNSVSALDKILLDIDKKPFDIYIFTPIIWSLETLAWVEENLLQCIRCLCELNLIESKVNFRNAQNSITTILFPFQPQTLASTDKIKSALKIVFKDYLQTEWGTIKALLPYKTTIITETAKPKYILEIQNRDDSVNPDRNELFDFIFSQAITFAKSDSEKISELVECVKYFDDNNQNMFYETVVNSYKTWSEKSIFKVWNKLNDLRIEIIRNNGGKSPSNTSFTKLVMTISLLEPKSVIEKTKRLFVSRFNDDDSIDPKLKQKAQYEGIKNIWEELGFDGVLELSNDLNNDSDLNIFNYLGTIIGSVELNTLLNRCFHDSEKLKIMQIIVNGYVNKNGIKCLLEIDWSKYNVNYISEMLIYLDLSNDLIYVADQLLKDDVELFWSKVNVTCYYEEVDYDINYVVSNLIKQKRFSTIIRFLGYSDTIPIKKELIYDILVNAAVNNVDNSRPDRYSVLHLIEYLQKDKNPNINILSDIEYLYLPYFSTEDIKPKALKTKIANDSNYFCYLISTMYKRKSDKAKKYLPREVSTRLFDIFFKFDVIAGTDWNGNFNKNNFVNWISETIKWAKDNDRYEIVQQVIGKGLSYAFVDSDDVEEVLLDVLDYREYDDIRKGFFIGTFNQRGAHFVDPEGRAEKLLSKKYEDMAIIYEQKGYSRFADTLREIAKNYIDLIDLEQDID